MRSWLAAFVFPLALGGPGSSAQADATRCEISATPENPGVTSEAIARADVFFSTTALIECFDDEDAPVAADPVCVSARRDEVSQTVELHRDGVTIPYAVGSNNVEIIDQEQQIWSGAVEASGRSLVVDYEVRADDFVGFPSGAYHASTTWAAHLNMESCP